MPSSGHKRKPHGGGYVRPIVPREPVIKGLLRLLYPSVCLPLSLTVPASLETSTRLPVKA